MNDEEIVRLLKEHYDGNVKPLPEKPDPGFDVLGKRLENAETFAETAAEMLNSYHWKRGKIEKSGLEGSSLAKHNPRLSLAVIKIPEGKIQALFKKLGFSERAAAATISKNNCGMNLVLLPDDERFEIIRKHEEAHVLWMETSRPYGVIVSFLREKDERDDSWFMGMNLKMERDILDEILAYGAQWDGATDEELSSYFREPARRRAETIGESGFLPDCGIVSRHGSQKIVEEKIMGYLSKRIKAKEITMANSKFYAANFAQEVGDMHLGPENGLLPNCGLVSRHKAKVFLENAAYEYFKKRFDEGNEAFKIVYKGLPFEKVSRIVRSCESVDELVEWSKHYGEVLSEAKTG